MNKEIKIDIFARYLEDYRENKYKFETIGEAVFDKYDDKDYVLMLLNNMEEGMEVLKKYPYKGNNRMYVEIIDACYVNPRIKVTDWIKKHGLSTATFYRYKNEAIKELFEFFSAKWAQKEREGAQDEK